MNKRFYFILFFAVVLIAGCTSLAKEQAEEKAKQFISEKVRFFARNETSVVDVPQHNIDSIDSYREDDGWVVVMRISSFIDNQTKKNDITVRLNEKGEVIELNGKEIPESVRS